MSEVVEVEVAGKAYRLQTDGDAADLMAVAALVDERIGQILAAAPGLPLERAAILAALNLGEELLAQRTRSEEIEAAVEAARIRLEKFAKRVEAVEKPLGDPAGSG